MEKESFSLIDVPIPSEDSLPDRRSSVTGVAKRSCEEDLDKDSESTKHVKMCDVDSAIQGLRKCSKTTEAQPHGHHNKEYESSQITETAASSLSDKPVQLEPGHIPEPDGTCLSLGLGVSSVQSSAIFLSNVALKQFDEARGPFSATNTENETNSRSTCSLGLALDLKENTFRPYKKLGHVMSVDESECGSTTGPVEENEPLRKWKEMKQNGFLSSSHGGIPIPKQQGRPPKRRNDEELRRNSELAKIEQSNKYNTNLAAPTTLLSGLNPGIIKHVRNSKQVNSIIEHMLQSEKREGQMQNRSMDQCEGGNMGISANNAPGNQFGLYPNRTFPDTSGLYMDGHGFSHENSTSSGCNSEYDDDPLTLKLSSSTSMASENACGASINDFLVSRDSLTSLSLKGASVASLWLDLLQQDIKGRLAALRRSKKRVRKVIQTELPCLLSREISSNQENVKGGYPEREIMKIHMARWKSIFSQMDKALHEEGKHLENWLKQVQDMEAHCDRGLKYFGADGSSRVGLQEETSVLKKTDVEREHAVMAAAASIYATSDFIMTKENVPCSL